MNTIPSVITGNKIIATYLGLEYIPYNNTEGKKAGWWKIGVKPSTNDIFTARHIDKKWYLGRSHNDLRFYDDWNALMDAIEVIEKDGETDKEYGNHVDVTTSYCRVGKITIDLKIEYPHLTKKQAAWLAVVRYCEQANPRHKTINQCDGCVAGYPVDENGLHIVPYPSGSMVCQANKYKPDYKVERDGSKTFGFILNTDDSQSKYNEYDKVKVSFPHGDELTVELGKPNRMVDAQNNFLGWSYGSHTPTVNWVAETWIEENPIK